MLALPDGFQEQLREIHQTVSRIEGWLAPREIDFLGLLAAVPLAEGVILEIGAWQGKSTVTLAMGSMLSDCSRIHTVDPLPPERLKENLQKANVAEMVEVHRAYSQEFRLDWQQPVRLFWHDGANSAEIVREDVRQLLPNLQDKGIIAFHDVLNTSGERIHVFLEDVLQSEHFGPVGVCGSIGWGMYHLNPQDAELHQKQKLRLYHQLKKLAKYHSAAKPAPTGVAKLRYRLMRSQVPHRAVKPMQWVKQVSVG